MAAKVFKLYIHQETFSENDLVINSKDFPNAKVGDVVEIYQPEEPNRRLLLQVKALKGDSQQKGISVDKTVANVFQLRPFIDVCVNFVSPQDVALDLVELTFKDQYISRSDMWRLKKSLVTTCAYITKKVEFAGIRAQIGECWMRSEKVGSGVITEDTKIVFRSSTSMVYLFIQLSREMWEFDIHGDLYWEKACMFLKELFTRWKENNSNHEVTIVVFSRTFYNADSVEEFPLSMRKCLQVDYKGRICEDFYRVVAQAERMEDWSPMLVTLKRHFIEYPNKTRYCKDEGCPAGHNSTAAQGNFLEAINMSLNVFEKHYIARNFDRTGQITVLITPGAGVFEVDRELTNITKQRMIDNGIGSDLVCLAEQPLHAVPLFKFHNKSAENYLGDDYNIPHWINHSFYAPKTEGGSTGFVPRIKMAETKPGWKGSKDGDLNGLYPMRNPTTTSTDDALGTMVDYDEYDAQVFKNPARSLGTRTYGKGLIRHSSDDMLEAKAHAQLRGRSRHASDDHRNLIPTSNVRQEKQRHRSEDFRYRVKQLKVQSSHAIKIPPSVPRKDSSMQASSLGSLHNFQITDHDEDTKRFVVGSASPTDRSKVFPTSAFPKVPTRKRALINPFAPSRLLVRLTSNRRRWTHTFPLGPTGEAMQHHHHKKSPVPEELAVAMDTTSPPSKGMLDANMAAVEARKQAGLLSDETVDNLHKSASLSSLGSDGGGGGLQRVDSAGSVASVINTYEQISGRGVGGVTGYRRSGSNLSWLWGMTGDQEWTPDLQTGVDWKSLTTPACLPITTDYFPEKHSLEYDYLESNYDLFALEDSMEMENIETGSRTRQDLTTQQVFTELISQRLMQGFQLIVLPKDSPLSVPQGHTTLSSSPRFSITRRKHRSEDQPSPTTSVHPSPDRSDPSRLAQGGLNVRTQLTPIKSSPPGVVEPPHTSTPLSDSQPPQLTTSSTEPGPPPVFSSPFLPVTEPPSHTHSSRRLSFASLLTPAPRKNRRFSAPDTPATALSPDFTTQNPQSTRLTQKAPSPGSPTASVGRLSRDSSPSTRSHLSVPGVLGSSPTLSRMWSSQKRNRAEDEYWLSMGRNFHKVVASRSRQSYTIHVTKYKPRHPSHTSPWRYHFRLWPVYQHVYDPARTEFQHDNLENYNWNYLDNYICSSGGEDFDLMDSLKFWRTRFLLLPAMSTSTKKLSETQETTFDIYPERSSEEQQQMLDGFLRFMEIVNRIRRPASNRKQKKIIQGIAKFMGLLRHVRNVDREERGEKQELTTSSAGGGRRAGFNLSAPTTPTAPLSPLPTDKDQSSQQGKQVESFPVPPSSNEVAVAMVTNNTENTEDLISDAMATTVVGEGEGGEVEEEGKLTLTSPPEVIIEAMKDTSTGVGFLPDQTGLPANIFISAEAVAWVSEAVDGVVSHLQAVELLQKLVEDHYIVHASLNPNHPFCNGFFLYCILSEENRKRVSEIAGRQYSGYQYQPDGTSFQSYWVEVSVMPVPMATVVPSFLSPRLRSDSKDTGSPDTWGYGSWMGGAKDVRIPGMKGNPPYKSMVLDVDMNKKSDRVEWCTLRYHGNYAPGCSFEFEVQWMVTTPNILYDLLSGWARKATSCGFHLVPVPYDPFALPESSTHDPLRRPQFIPLQLEGCLGEGQTSLFEEFGPDTHSERLQLFQEAILKRFGFVRDNSRPGSGSYYLHQTNRLQFVHETGVALVQIPEYKSKPRGIQKFKASFSHVNTETRTLDVPSAESRTRHPSSDSATADDKPKVGFYWTYNYVLTKRWRSSSTGEERFGERLLADLTSFCSDEEWRLRDYWKECQQGPLESALGQ